jgi:GTPase SAR1 family protein
LIKGFILFIGPSAAGKTSILRRLVTGKFEDQKPTLSYWEENIAKVRIIEIGGQESLKKYWKVALDQNPLWIFFVIDVTKESDYLEYKEFVKDDYYSKVSERTTLAANKTDLTDTIPNHLSDNGYVIQCSAKTGEGMLDILEMIANLEGNLNSIE